MKSKQSATHVDALSETSRDAGSIPAASTFDNNCQTEKNDDNSRREQDFGALEAKVPVNTPN